MVVFMKRVMRLSVYLVAAAIAASALSLGVFAESGASLNRKTLNMPLGKSFTLKVSNAGGNTVSWSSSDKSIATVNSNGRVTALKKGNVRIGAKVGDSILVCRIRVIEPTAPASKPPVSSDETAESYGEEMLKLINAERKKEEASPLSLDETLCKAANIRAEEIARSFSHQRPDGKEFKTVLTEVGIETSLHIGENISAGSSTAKDTFERWMKSPGHKRNILTADYKKVGIGYYYDSGGKYKYYWVQIFSG
ncbi:MAG: CAP domain-containing protein [Oscillospiraceae bacterium]|nr:CAP domain-containing protein [Oscillospiraceae bacterium]